MVDLRHGFVGGLTVIHGARVTNASFRFPYDGSSGYWLAFRATGEPDPHAARVKELESRERALLDVAAVEDWSRFPAAVDEWWWQRGFVGKVKLSAADWIAHGDHILAQHPVQEVAMTTMPTWTRDTPYGDGYARLIGREKCESIGCIVGSPDNWPLVLKLLRAEWPTVKTWHLPPAIRGEDLMRMWERFRPDAELLGMIDRASWAAMNNAITPELIRDSAIDLG